MAGNTTGDIVSKLWNLCVACSRSLLKNSCSTTMTNSIGV